MKTEIKLTDALGKTLQGFESSITSPQAVLTFSDDTFTTLDIYRGYEEGDETILEGSLLLDQFGDEKLIRLGIITQEELDEGRKKERAVFDDAREKRERAEYERLSRKFGS